MTTEGQPIGSASEEDSVEGSFESGPIEAYFESAPLESNSHTSSPNRTMEMGSTCLASRIQKDGQTFFKKTLRKELQDKSLYRNAFFKEFTLGAKMDCIYFPHYHELMEEDGTLCILMDNIEGLTLDHLLAAQPDYFNDKENLKKFLTQLTEGLAYLHNRQIVHHDLSPHNIMLTTVNHDVRIIDFGYCYADSFQSSLGQTNGFSAPERQSDARSDIYSVGCLLQYISEHSFKPLSKHTMDVAAHCKAESPDDRYPNIQALQKALKDTRWYKRPLPYLLLGVCLAALGGWWYVQHNRPYDFSSREYSSNRLYYKIINEDSLWVEVVNPKTYNINEANPDYLNAENNIAIPDKVQYDGKYYTVVGLGDGCFFGCHQLQVVTLPQTLRTIGMQALQECSELSICSLPESVRNIKGAAFFGDSCLTELALPTELEKLEDKAFTNCSEKKMVVPHRIKELEQDCFAGSPYLEEVVLPDSLERICRGVFYACPKLTKITIPQHVKEIDELVFYECPQFTDLTLLPLTPPKAYKVFSDPRKITLHVPAQALAAYQKDAYWSQCKIVALDQPFLTD